VQKGDYQIVTSVRIPHVRRLRSILPWIASSFVFVWNSFSYRNSFTLIKRFEILHFRSLNMKKKIKKKKIKNMKTANIINLNIFVLNILRGLKFFFAKHFSLKDFHD